MFRSIVIIPGKFSQCPQDDQGKEQRTCNESTATRSIGGPQTNAERPAAAARETAHAV